ncbi:unnamed protein product, partial [Closterium sp. Naga37s-1]
MLYAVLPPASDPLPPLPSAHARDSSPASSARNSRGAAAVDGAAHGRKGAHARTKSWDVGAGAEGGGEGGRAADAGGGAAAPRLVPAMMTSLSLTVECLMTTASVSIQGTWEVGEYARGRGQGGGGGGGGEGRGEGGGGGGGDGGVEGEEQQQCCDCLFVLPTSHRSHVTAVEVTLADGRFLATAVLPADEAEAACRASQERAAAAHSAAQPVPPRPARSSFLRLSSASFSRSGSSRHRWKSQEGVGDGDGRAEARTGEWGESSGKEGGVSGGVERGEGGVERGEGGGESEWRRGGDDEDEEEEEVEGSGGQRRRCVARRHAAVLLDESPVHTPHMLRLRIPKVPQGSSVRVRVTYVEAMAGRQGYSEMSVPLTVPLGCVPGDLAVQDVVRVSCTINSGLQCPMKIGDFNHPMKVVFVDLGRATFVGHPIDEDPEAWPNADFTISFQVVTEDVSAAVLVQAPLIGDPDPRAAFALSMAPPDPSQFSILPHLSPCTSAAVHTASLASHSSPSKPQLCSKSESPLPCHLPLLSPSVLLLLSTPRQLLLFPQPCSHLNLLLHMPPSNAFVSFWAPFFTTLSPASRAVVFVLDSETGLRGRPMEDARRAVAAALRRLKPHDSFAVVSFDFELLLLDDELEAASPLSTATLPSSVAPPSPSTPLHPSPPLDSRAVVFILDSECGLRARPMEDARRAVAAALRRLKPHDSFAVVAFDFELLLLDDELEAASPEAVRRACKFVLQAHDWPQPTNALTPLQLVGGWRAAFRMLRGHTAALQQIVLITDGPVRAERRVCHWVQRALADWGGTAPRIFTFGIGPSVNPFFLKWLAAATRGSSQVTRNPGGWMECCRPWLARSSPTLPSATCRPPVSSTPTPSRTYMHL